MGRLSWVFGAVLLASMAWGQGGGFGGGGFGGGGGGQGQGGGGMQGPDGDDDSSRRAFPYLNQRETVSILTPGEYVEWELDVKKGQVVIAEARSEAFDPALEIVEGDKVLVDNDDRYSGDQRPLLLWSCPKDGKYLLRIRSFRGRAGGQVFSRHVQLNCHDVNVGFSEFKPVAEQPMLLRYRLKRGDFVQLRAAMDGIVQAPIKSERIAPGGFRYTDATPNLRGLTEGSVCALIDGDYYAYLDRNFSRYYGRETVRVQLEKIAIRELDSKPSTSTVNGVRGAVFAVSLKKGDFIRLDTGQAQIDEWVVVDKAPDFDTISPKTNPYGQSIRKEEDDRSFAQFPMQGTWTSSCTGVVAREDTKVWVGRAAGIAALVRNVSLIIDVGATSFVGDNVQGRMKIGDYQYWEFNANAGDVIKLAAAVKGFSSEVELIQPSLDTVARTSTWQEDARGSVLLVARETGRYLLRVNCRGHGGTGTYSLSRQIVPPTILEEKGASGTLAADEVKVMKFTLRPGPTKLLKVSGTASLQFTDLKGQSTNLIRVQIGQNVYFYGHPLAPTTFLVVISGDRANYNLSFVDPP